MRLSFCGTTKKVPVIYTNANQIQYVSMLSTLEYAKLITIHWCSMALVLSITRRICFSKRDILIVKYKKNFHFRLWYNYPSTVTLWNNRNIKLTCILESMDIFFQIKLEFVIYWFNKIQLKIFIFSYCYRQKHTPSKTIMV